MSYQKALCLICELPTADGAVLAVHVDKEKLQEWFLNVGGHELAEDVDDDDLICYFCVWHAEFLWKFNGMSDESLVWWPRNSDYLDDAAKELRMYYFEGKLEQCWVPLEKVKLPKDEEDIEDSDAEIQPTTIEQAKKKCFYCAKPFQNRNISRHVKKTHKNAIRCEIQKCATYFHTIEEREKHNEEVHAKPSRKLKIFQCDFCSKEFSGNSHINMHVRRFHREFPVKCVFFGCVSFFKSEIEMRAHFDSLHDVAKMIDCEFCDYKTSSKNTLRQHVARKHMKKTLKCDKCDEMFSVNGELSTHERKVHTLKRCKICTFDVSVGYFTQHVKKRKCSRCKNNFQCSGLYQSHLKKCRETLLKCSKCPSSFQFSSLLIYHMKRKHRNHEWRGLEHRALGFKCEPCKRYYKSNNLLKIHLYRIHDKANLKYCAHCSKNFHYISALKIHLAAKHNLIVGHLPCSYCSKTFVSLKSRNIHQKVVHAKNKVRENCDICGKTMFSSYMRKHLLLIHGETSVRQ